MAADEILLDVEEKMEHAVDYYHRELRGIRTGRASTGLVEHIKIDYYGTPTDLRQLANLSTPEPTMILVKPFDPGSVKDIERGIQSSDLGITPASDGKVIRLIIPPLSGERRDQLVQQTRKMAEAARVTVRNARRDGNKLAEKQQKDSELTEDECKRTKGEIQKLTDQYEQKINDALESKVKEIEEV